MSKILFINQPSVGHLNTLLNIALQMKEDGHECSFLIPGIENTNSKISIIQTAALIPGIVKKAGLAVDIINPPLVSAVLSFFLPFLSGYNELMLAMELASTGVEQYTKSVLKYIEKNKPDMLVVDFSFFAGYLASEVMNIPCAIIYHSGLPFKGELIPPFGSGLPIGKNAQTLRNTFFRREQFMLSRLDKRIAKVRSKFGLVSSEKEMLYTPYSKWLNLLTSAEVIEAPRDSLTDTTYFIGPCFAKRKGNLNNFPFDQLHKDKYKIYVSLGTVFNNKPNVFRKIMSALNYPEYQVIVSAGGAFDKLMQGSNPNNAMIFPSVPQVDLLPHIDLVIGHGGNNTTNETLAAGKPLIIMPVGGEQGDNASRIEYLGAGLRVDINNFDERELKNKVDKIRTTQDFKNRVLELKEALGKTNGAKTSSALIAWVAKTKKPLIRPKGFPLTVTIDNYLELNKELLT